MRVLPAGGVPLQDCAHRRARLLRSRSPPGWRRDRNGAGRSRTSCPHVAEYRQRVLLFPSFECKTIPFNKDGLANVLSFGGQRCRPWQYAWKRNKEGQRLSKRHGHNLRKRLPTNPRKNYLPQRCAGNCILVMALRNASLSI